MNSKNNTNNGKHNHTPDSFGHKVASMIKSGIRIVGYSFLLFDITTACFVLIISELIDVVEELVYCMIYLIYET